MYGKTIKLIFALLAVLTLGACTASPSLPASPTIGSVTVPPTPATASMPTAAVNSQGTTTTMGHGNMRMDATSFDVTFIDSMIQHHQGAIAMAQQAQKESQRAEIQQIAQYIIRDQQHEVEQMQSWRKAWYPNIAQTGGMGMAMGDMQVSGDTGQPYDQRFITAMIGHHQGAVAMAKEALTKAEHPEIKQLAQTIIAAQEAEIRQMQGWNRQWFAE